MSRISLQSRTAAFCLGASSCHLQSDNKMSPPNLNANFCTFLSILYKTTGKLAVFWSFVDWWAICININSNQSQISRFSCSFNPKFTKTWEHLQSDIIYSPTSGASTRRPRRPFPYGPGQRQAERQTHLTSSNPSNKAKNNDPPYMRPKHR